MIINNAVLTGSFIVNGVNYITNTPTTGSNTFVGTQTTSGSTLITGSLQVTGSIATTGTITAQTLVVQTVTSSIVYSSGSNIFGNSLTNTQKMTGSMLVTGSITQAGASAISLFSGNVGIGTTSLINPSAKLEVKGDVFITPIGSVASKLHLYNNDSTNETYIYDSGSSSTSILAFAPGGVTKMVVISSGNVGIGTSSPTTKLEVNDTNGVPLRFGDISTSITGQTAGYIGMSTSAYSGNNGDLVLFPRTSATSNILLMSGSVGIGTTAPATTLHALGPIRSQDSRGGSLAAVEISGGNSSLNPYISVDQSNPLTFIVGAAERMRITSAGSLTIGTTEVVGSNSKLIVSSSDAGPSFINQTQGQQTLLCWNKATSGDNLWVEFHAGSTLGVKGSIDYNRASNVTRFNTTSDANLKNIIGDSNKQKSIGILSSTKIKEYSWKDDTTNKSQIGVIAQELYETFKGAVSKGSDDELLGTEDYKPWAVDKTAFTFHLIAGWQEHEQLIQELKAENDTLKERLTALENK